MNSVSSNQTSVELELEDGSYIDEDFDDMDPIQKIILRKEVWDNLFWKYSNIRQSKGDIGYDEMSIYADADKKLTTVMKHNTKPCSEPGNVYANKGQSTELVTKMKDCDIDDNIHMKDPKPNNSKSSAVSKKSADKCVYIDGNKVFTKRETFLFTYLTRAEIQKILGDEKFKTVDITRIISVVEETFKSNLKQLVAYREEARYTGDDEKFSKYHQAAQVEAERLHDSLGKKYVAIYLASYKCSVSMDEIIHLIEQKHTSNLAKCFVEVTRSHDLPSERVEVIWKKFIDEWFRLKAYLPVGYLVEYCGSLELLK